MKTKLIIISIIFLASLSYGQKITRDQATALISQYTAQEAELQTRITEGTAKVDSLKDEIAQLDAEIYTLSSRIEELKVAATKEEYTYYVVREGDWLAKLAEYPEVYGRGNYAKWPKIYHANKDQIKDPTLIVPGWKLRVPRP